LGTEGWKSKGVEESGPKKKMEQKIKKPNIGEMGVPGNHLRATMRNLINKSTGTTIKSVNGKRGHGASGKTVGGVKNHNVQTE